MNAAALPLVCAGVALVELDGVHVGQWMVSRPLVLGPVLGAACDAPWLGVGGGALVELFCVDVLPVGAALPINGAVAVAVLLLLAAGSSAVPVAAAFPAALLMGSLFRRVENAVRAGRTRLARRAGEAAARGEPPRLGRWLLLGLVAHAAVTAVYVYAAAAGLGPVLGWGWAVAPAAARRGVELAFMNAPWLGLGALLYSLRPRG